MAGVIFSLLYNEKIETIDTDSVDNLFHYIDKKFVEHINGKPSGLLSNKNISYPYFFQGYSGYLSVKYYYHLMLNKLEDSIVTENEMLKPDMHLNYGLANGQLGLIIPNIIALKSKSLSRNLRNKLIADITGNLADIITHIHFSPNRNISYMLPGDQNADYFVDIGSGILGFYHVVKCSLTYLCEEKEFAYEKNS